MLECNSIVTILIVSLVGSLISAPADARLRVCNKSGEPQISVAIATKQNELWLSEGWWNLGPAECSTVYDRDLTETTIYLYAFGGSVNVSGPSNFCTKADSEFLIEGTMNCTGRGYQQHGFLVIDAGEQKDWTQNIAGVANQAWLANRVIGNKPIAVDESGRPFPKQSTSPAFSDGSDAAAAALRREQDEKLCNDAYNKSFDIGQKNYDRRLNSCSRNFPQGEAFRSECFDRELQRANEENERLSAKLEQCIAASGG